MTHIRTILHPTDFSERSQNAFRLASALARDYGAELILVHVASVPTMAYGEGFAATDPEAQRAELRNRLLQLLPDGDVRTAHRLEEGQPAPVILRVADEMRADLIVMGTHGRRGLARLLMGSVAEQIARRAKCPVLTVRVPFVEAAPVAMNRTAEPVSAGSHQEA
jgi:nucleotide-binding universal stress UspA family protein